MGEDLRKTPLHEQHVRLQGKMVPFGGWEMPLHYPPGILKEHEAVRRTAGLFDVSHMGRYEVRGPGAASFTNHLITNDLGRLEPGRLLYTPICNEDGGVLDDVTVYHRGDRMLLVVNASNRAVIWNWLTLRRTGWDGPEVELADRSGELAQLALQGPRAPEILAGRTGGDLEDLGYYHFRTTTLLGVDAVLVSRNGYTGEDGFEIYFAAEHAPQLWSSLLDAGAGVGLVPAGLGCRDTLRMEMAYCLYGNELSPEVSPLEAGLGWTVKLKKKQPFVGQERLRAQKSAGVERTLIGFEVEGRRLARPGQTILRGGGPVGTVTSGGYAPSLQKGIGLGLVSPSCAETGTSLEVDVRGTSIEVAVVDRPFYKHGSHR